jgi:hypothetical protein
LVGVRRGVANSNSIGASNREDVQTAQAASSNKAGRREDNSSPCICAPNDYEDDQNSPYIPTADEMLRELEAVGA